MRFRIAVGKGLVAVRVGHGQLLAAFFDLQPELHREWREKTLLELPRVMFGALEEDTARLVYRPGAQDLPLFQQGLQRIPAQLVHGTARHEPGAAVHLHIDLFHRKGGAARLGKAALEEDTARRIAATQDAGFAGYEEATSPTCGSAVACR